MMDRVKNLMDESQSGAELFFNSDDNSISLGTLHCLLCEVEYAVQAVQSVIDQLDHGYEDDAISAMMGHLALDYAYDCLMAIRPCKDADGRMFGIEDNKITYATPKERYAALMEKKAKAQKSSDRERL